MRVISQIGLTFIALVAHCQFVAAASSTWRCEFPKFDEPLTFTTELGTGRGKIIGNAGTADIWVVEGALAVSFIEPLGSGAVQVTTIVLKSGEAAHSRNTVMSIDGTFMPSQVLGSCSPWN